VISKRGSGKTLLLGPGGGALEVWRSYVDIPLDRLPGLRLGDDVVAYFCEGARHGVSSVGGSKSWNV
jgi:hypothetical protein